jgi:hypothetical protein
VTGQAALGAYQLKLTKQGVVVSMVRNIALGTWQTSTVVNAH